MLPREPANPARGAQETGTNSAVGAGLSRPATAFDDLAARVVVCSRRTQIRPTFGSGHDPSLWVIAFDGDEIAGGVVNIVDPEENAQTGNHRGYVEAVFTRPAWRRRGLARALVAESLVRLRDRGMTSALLGVDGANPNQAMTLYEDIGFEIAATELEWRRPLTAGEEPR